MRKLATITALSAAIVGGGLAVASTVGADSDTVTATQTTGIIKAATTSYTSPSNKSTAVHYNLRPNQTVDIRCFTEGDVIHGQQNWIRIGLDSKVGFVHKDAIHVPSAAIPHC